MYSHEPKILGRFDVDCKQFLFYQYLPVILPGTGLRVPMELFCFKEPIRQIALSRGGWFAKDEYVYLTAKRMYIAPDCSANRMGWHIDGFGTEDTNYIWSDSLPTEFCIQEFDLCDDHAFSLQQMDAQAKPENVRSYPLGSFLELDSQIVHRVAAATRGGYRTFCKISISKHRYNLEGNAHNYLFDYDWPMIERTEARNHPIGSVKC